MTESLFSLIQQAPSVANVAGAKIHGVEVAIVTNVRDPDRLGRVKVCFPWLQGSPESGWARVVHPAAGDGRGFYWMPHVDDEVLVAFDGGDSSMPIVLGCLWNGKDRPPEAAYADSNTTHMIQTRSGHQIIFDDEAGKERIVIADQSGKRVLIFDVAGKKLVIADGAGDVEVRAAKKILFDCEDLEVKARKSGKLDIGTTFDLSISDKGCITAGPRLDLKASKIDINPGAGGGGGGGSSGAGRAATAEKQAKGAAAAASRQSHARQGSDLGADQAPHAQATADKPGEAPAAAAQDDATQVAPDGLDVQLVNAAGKPQKKVGIEVTLPGGEKRAGLTDDNGHFKLERLATTQGNAKLDVPDVPVAPKADPTVAGRVRFVDGGVDVPIGRATVVELPPRVRRARMKGMHFDTGKTFLLPSAMTGIRQLVKLYNSFEGIFGLVTGHTDRQGKGGVDASQDPGAVEFNRGLSNERADAIKAYLLDDAKTWTQWYGKMPHSRQWGVLEDQQMLATVKPKGSDTPFLDPAAVDGKAGPATSQAWKDFQHSRLLDETGKPDPDSRRALVEAYMAMDGTSLKSGSPLETHGCGLTHPTPETEGDPSQSPEERAKAKPDQPVNRRVEVFLFEDKIDPAPKKPCPSKGCDEYQKWVDLKVLDVDLDAPPGAIDVKVTDEAGNPISGAHVHASGPLVLDSTSGNDGKVAGFTEIIPGTYKVIADDEALGFSASDATVDVAPGATASVTLVLKAMAQPLLLRVLDPKGAPIRGRPFRLEKESGEKVAEGKTDAKGNVAAPADLAGNVKLVLLDPPRALRLRARLPGTSDERASIEVGPGSSIELVFEVAHAKKARIVDAAGATVLDGLDADAQGKGTAKLQASQATTLSLVALPDTALLQASQPASPVQVQVSADPEIRKFEARKPAAPVTLIAGEEVEFAFEVAGARQVFLTEKVGEAFVQVGDELGADANGRGTTSVRPAKATSFELLALGTAQRMAVSDPIEVAVAPAQPAVKKFIARTDAGESASASITAGDELTLVFAVEQADLVQLVERTAEGIQTLGSPVAAADSAALRIVPRGDADYTLIAISSIDGAQSPESPPVSVRVQPGAAKLHLLGASGAPLAGEPFRVERQDGTLLAEGGSDADGAIALEPGTGPARLILFERPRVAKFHLRTIMLPDERRIADVSPRDEVEVLFKVVAAREVQLVDVSSGKEVAVGGRVAPDASGNGSIKLKPDKSARLVLIAFAAEGPKDATARSPQLVVNVSPPPAIGKFKVRRAGSTEELDAVEIEAGDEVEFVFQASGTREAILMEVEGEFSFQTGAPIPLIADGTGSVRIVPEKTTAYELSVEAPGERGATAPAVQVTVLVPAEPSDES